MQVLLLKATLKHLPRKMGAWRRLQDLPDTKFVFVEVWAPSTVHVQQLKD